MRTFVIVDSSKRKAKPIGTLFWEADSKGGQGRFSLELSSDCDEERLPLSLSFCANRKHRRATPKESADWVRSRIVPEDRHNIAEVLAANGLAEYDQVGLLAACKGRSSDDDLLVYEVELPEDLVDEVGYESPGGQSAEGSCASLTADRVIAAVERQRTGTEVRYAFVSLNEEVNNRGRLASDTAKPSKASASLTAAQCIGADIRDERKRQGLTQKQLAARAGITQTVLSRVESGTGNPTLALLEELSAALGTQLDISLA